MLTKCYPSKLVFVVEGLPGSGKSSTLRMLYLLFGNTFDADIPAWVNQDELDALTKSLQSKSSQIKDKHDPKKKLYNSIINGGKPAKKFQQWIQIVMDGDTSIVCIDKINTLKQHREGIYQALGPTEHYIPILLNFTADSSICFDRIMKRSGHRTLDGSDPQDLKKILTQIESGKEEFSLDEKSKYRLIIDIDPEMSPQETVVEIIRQCITEELVDVTGVDVKQLVDEVYGQSIAYESAILTPKTKEKSKSKKIMYVGLFPDINEETKKILGEHLDIFMKMYPSFPEKIEKMEPVKDIHVTTEFLGGKKPVSDIQLAMMGQSYPIQITGFASDGTLLCATVKLNDTIPCTNDHPHMTMSLLPGTKAVKSNTVLSSLMDGSDDIKYYPLDKPIVLNSIMETR
jgi:dephospho-CoA kinase